jgi:hypothetical protein
MKKILSILACAVMLACVILPAVVSADGQILWTDDFSSVKENDWIWDAGTTNFFVENGKLEGWAEAVVHQSNFLVDRGAPRRYKECAFKVECAGLEDGGNDAEGHYLGIWFADYISPYGDPDQTEGTLTYACGYEFEKKLFTVSVGFDNAAEDFKPADLPEDGKILSVPIPDSEAPVMDPSGKSSFTIGMRLSGGKVAFYMNDKKVGEINAYRGAVSFTQVGSPILLFNTQLHCTFDNLTVSTADYNLFNESAEQAQNQQNVPVATEKVIETKKVVVGTDAEGNEITEIVTEEVVRPAAQTSNGTTGGTSSATGDMAVIVIALMIVALGTAIIVKKVCTK